MKRIAGILVVGALIGLMACNNNCYVPTYTALGVSFVDSTTLKPKTVQMITVKGVGSDSVLYNNANASSVYMPLKQQSTETVFEISFKKNNADPAATPYLLKVNYQSYPQLISPECGCVLFHSIDSAQCSNSTDTLKLEIYNASVINVAQDVHLKIYL